VQQLASSLDYYANYKTCLLHDFQAPGPVVQYIPCTLQNT